MEYTTLGGSGVTVSRIGLGCLAFGSGMEWMLDAEESQALVDAPIVGASSPEHLEEAVEAVGIDLSDSDLAYLEEPYEPIPVVGHGRGS